MADELDQRARALVRVVTNRAEWDRWSRSPARLATLLGVCEDGEQLIGVRFVPMINQLLARPRSSGRRGRVPMPEEEQPNDSDGTTEEGIKLAREGLDLIRIGLREKKKKDKLSALASAWEDAGQYKDILILKYEEDRIPEDRKAKAKAIREKLEEIQRLLRAMHRKILNDEDFKDEQEKVIEALREVITELALL